MTTAATVLETAADVAYLAGAGRRSVELARRCPRGRRRHRPASFRRALQLRLGRNAWAIGDADAAFDAYRRARPLVPADPPSAELARILAEEARGLMLMSRFADAERFALDALAVAAAAGAVPRRPTS